MTLEEFTLLLKQTNFPVACGEFKTKPSYPCIVYLPDGKRSVSADNTNYSTRQSVRIELYTEKYKSIQAENAIENVLSATDIVFSQSEPGYIREEGLYEVVYDIEI